MVGFNNIKGNIGIKMCRENGTARTQPEKTERRRVPHQEVYLSDCTEQHQER